MTNNKERDLVRTRFASDTDAVRRVDEFVTEKLKDAKEHGNDIRIESIHDSIRVTEVPRESEQNSEE